VNYGNQTVSSPTLVTSHSVMLSGLTPNTLYSFTVSSANAASVSTTSSSYTFTTSTASAAGPVISYVAYWGITSSGITISWSTNVPSNTSVAYGTTNALTSVTPVQTALSNSHGVTLTGLQPSTLYYFQAQSADVNGNTGTSTVYSFTTLAGGTPVISNVLVTPGSGNTASIGWTTSVPTYSYVQYGTSSGNYIRYSALTSLTASPNVSLGYVPSGTVYYQLVSTDANGDLVVSAEATFVEP
jgi:phosphodiesterase/alkaline phosphatase D-like protein